MPELSRFRGIVISMTLKMTGSTTSPMCMHDMETTSPPYPLKESFLQEASRANNTA